MVPGQGSMDVVTPRKAVRSFPEPPPVGVYSEVASSPRRPLMNRIPVLVPRLPVAERLLPYLQRIDRQRSYTNFGPLNAEFERRIVDEVAPALSADHVTTVANCTVGLELALQAFGLRPGARVLIPAISFVATASAVRRMGMLPVFADVDEASWVLTPEIAAAAHQHAPVDAVMPVATYGCGLDTDAWDAFTSRSGIPVLIDAAGAFGNQGVGRTTDVVFSFHATKSFGIGEGGAVLSSEAGRIATIRRASNFGIDVSIGRACEPGTNGKLSEYHSAVGLAAFDEWPALREERRLLQGRYRARLREHCPALTFQRKAESHVAPVFPVLLPDGCSSVQVAELLLQGGIETRRWYCPALPRHPVFADAPCIGELRGAAAVEARLLGLPFFLDISETQMEIVCEQLATAIAAAIAVPSSPTHAED